MKPTPSKLVLLMSAAGLGLSWSGVALAARDGNAPASVALSFGVAPRSDQGCGSESADAWVLCPASYGALVNTIVAKTAALPLALKTADSKWDTTSPLQSVDVDAARDAQRAGQTLAGNDPPTPDNDAPLTGTPIAARGADDSSHQRKADAIAMVLMDDLRDIAEVTAPAAVPVVRAHTSAVATPPHSEFNAGHRSARLDRDAQAAAVEEVAADDSAAIDRVFASLAEVLGSELDGSPPRIEAKHEQAAVTDERVAATVSTAALRASTAATVAEQPAQSVVQLSPVAAPLAEGAALQQSSEAEDIVVASSRSDKMSAPAVAEWPAQSVAQVPPAIATLDEGSTLQRSSEAEDIVVVSSHSDKILMNLEALRSGESLEPGRLGAQTKKTVVVRHTDKVLETLALFQSKKPKRAAWACTGAPDEESRVAMESEPKAAWVFGEPSAESALAGIGLEPDILLDLELPASDRSQQPAMYASSSQASLAVPPVTAPRERSAIGGDLVALNADQLDEVRGGFVTDGGLKISFGIERAVYLNGTLVTTTSLNIADLSKISGGQAQVTSNGTAGSLAVLQSGVGNVFAPGSISSTAAGTVIQNTLDNQKINTITRIDAVVNSSGIMRSMNLQSSMQSAIVNSLRR